VTGGNLRSFKAERKPNRDPAAVRVNEMLIHPTEQERLQTSASGGRSRK
jgi:hypothetical protein